MFAPINKLPPEILVHTCTFVPASEAKSDFAHICAQVCRHWWNTLISSPSLWNEILVEEPLHADVHLTRSGEVPLEVYFYRASPVDRFCRKIVPHLNRVRLLYLSLNRANCETILDSLEASGRAMSLRKFHFQKGSSELNLSASMMVKISSFATNITALVLWNIDVHLSSLTFPCLLYFYLVTQVGFQSPRVSDVIGLLRGSPLLEEVDLHYASYSDLDNAGTHIEPVTLQHLKRVLLKGRPSPSLHPLPYIEADLLPYLSFPSAGQCRIDIYPASVSFPHGTSYLLSLIRAWELISGHGGGFGRGDGFTRFELFIKESPDALSGWLGVVEQGDIRAEIFLPEDMYTSSWPFPMPDWETTTTDGETGTGYAAECEIQAQLTRLGGHLDPLRWNPSPLATLKSLVIAGFGYTTSKARYLEYLRECFEGLSQLRHFQAKETNLWMITHLLRPYEDGSGGMALLFPLLESLSFCNCAPVGPLLPTLLEAMKERAALGNVLETVSVDYEKVDLSELGNVQGTT